MAEPQPSRKALRRGCGAGCLTGSGGLIVVYAIIALAVSPVGEGPEEMERAIETGVSIGQVGFPLVWIAACAIGWHVYRRAKEKVDDGG